MWAFYISSLVSKVFEMTRYIQKESVFFVAVPICNVHAACLRYSQLHVVQSKLTCHFQESGSAESHADLCLKVERNVNKGR